MSPRAEPLGEPAGPGIADPERAERGGIDPARRRRLEIAGREHDRVGGDRPAVGEPHRARPSMSTASPRTISIPCRLGEQLGEIVAVEHARRDNPPRRRRPRREPADEMVGIVGDRRSSAAPAR